MSGGRPRLRVTFFGDEPTFGAAMLRDEVAGLRPTCVDLRPTLTLEQLRDAVRATDPDVVVVLGPRWPPGEVFDHLPALVLAAGRPEGQPHWADRVISGGVWREAPLPVDDRLFAPARLSSAR